MTTLTAIVSVATIVVATLYGGTRLYASFIVWLVIGRGTNERPSAGDEYAAAWNAGLKARGVDALAAREQPPEIRTTAP